MYITTLYMLKQSLNSNYSIIGQLSFFGELSVLGK